MTNLKKIRLLGQHICRVRLQWALKNWSAVIVMVTIRQRLANFAPLLALQYNGLLSHNGYGCVYSWIQMLDI